MLWQESHSLLKFQIVCHGLARGDWIGMKDRKRSREKTEGLKKGIGMTRGLTGTNYMHVYSHC